MKGYIFAVAISGAMLIANSSRADSLLDEKFEQCFEGIIPLIAYNVAFPADFAPELQYDVTDGIHRVQSLAPRFYSGDVDAMTAKLEPDYRKVLERFREEPKPSPEEMNAEMRPVISASYTCASELEGMWSEGTDPAIDALYDCGARIARAEARRSVYNEVFAGDQNQQRSELYQATGSMAVYNKLPVKSQNLINDVMKELEAAMKTEERAYAISHPDRSAYRLLMREALEEAATCSQEMAQFQ